jgi:hypothetical protein
VCIDYQEGRTENSDYHVGNEMESKDLTDCQEGSRELPYFQEGKGEQMSSELSSYQKGQMTEEKDQKNILINGGIQIFLPGSPVEVRVCVVDVAAIERQVAETVKEEEELEKISKAAQEEEGNEHSEEWLKFFSQEAETEMTAALELAAVEEEEADSMSFVDLCEQIEALERRVIVQRMHIQQMKLEADAEGEYQPKE